jgi:ribosomal protein S18 acetylase RimI-like enzyme
VPFPVLTAELARRIERADRAAGAARVARVRRLPGNPLGIVARRFGRATARLVRRPRWYYHYFGGVDDPAAAAAALPWFRASGVALRLTLCPFFADEALLARLHGLGMRQSGFMTATYGQPAADERPPPGVELREDRAAFVPFYLGYAPEAERAELRPIVEAEFADWRCYVALVGGEVAAGGALFVADGVGVLAAAGTLPAFRGRGAQTALLRRRIADAGAAGCDLVVCSAVPGSVSQRNQERVGLRTAYTRVTWVDAAPQGG